MTANDVHRDILLSHREQIIAEHWARRLITFNEALALLSSRGLDLNRATPEDLHVFDIAHVGGVESTDLLAREAGICNSQRVLDVGSGLGGPARRFAYKYGAIVSGLELSEPVYRTAVDLTSLVGLADQVGFHLGSALRMPYEDGTFDVVVMQHCAMQVVEKPLMFRECARVLHTRGVLAMHEFFADSSGDPHYPLAWATEPAMSSLHTLADTVSLLSALGFTIGPFLDQDNIARAFYAEMVTKLEKAMAEGTGWREKGKEETRNRLWICQAMLKNFQEHRLHLGIFVCRTSKT
jgi:ubiquinone/menaquinone biosynthesis C-methylase UbiE